MIVEIMLKIFETNDFFIEEIRRFHLFRLIFFMAFLNSSDCSYFFTAFTYSSDFKYSSNCFQSKLSFNSIPPLRELYHRKERR